MATSGAHGLAAIAITVPLPRAFTKGSSGKSPGIGGGPSGRVSETTAEATLFCCTAAGLLVAFSSANPAIQPFSSAISPSFSLSPFGGIFGSSVCAHTLNISEPSTFPGFTAGPLSPPASAP